MGRPHPSLRARQCKALKTLQKVYQPFLPHSPATLNEPSAMPDTPPTLHRPQPPQTAPPALMMVQHENRNP